MGGYGALRIGMKRPDVYSAMWAMAPCCLNQGSPSAAPGGQPSPLEGIKTVEQARKGDRRILVGFASAAAWSPNPDNPPLFLDLPTKDGVVVPEVAARYGANSPLAMVSQYAPNLRKYRAVVVDVGKDDTLLPSIRQFEARLKQLGVPHEFSVRDGDHGSHVVPQFGNKILPFFSQNLSFEQPAR
jgi:S-formylglutathione hydrolase FrmB